MNTYKNVIFEVASSFFPKPQDCVDDQRDGVGFQGDVSDLLLALWKMNLFTTSRWLAVGLQSRRMVAARLTGLESFVHWVSGQDGVSLYYLNGYKRMDANAWQFVCHAAVVTTVADKFISELTDEGRLAMTVLRVRQHLADAVNRLAFMALDVWFLLGHYSGQDPAHFRSCCMKALHRFLAFLSFRCLDKATALPFSLCRGDIATNLEELAAGPRPQDAVAAHIWDLATDESIDQDRLRRIVALLGDLPWTTVTTEQAHCWASIVHRFHPDMELDALLARACALGVSRLLPQPSALVLQKHRLVARIKRLRRRDPRRACGRQAFCSALSKVASRRYRSSQARQLAQRKIIKFHHGRYERLSADMKMRFEVAARAIADRKLARIDEQVKKLAGDLATVNAELAQAASGRPQFTFHNATWGPTELLAIERHQQATTRSIGDARALVCGGAPDMSPSLRQALEDTGAPHVAAAKAATPAWVTEMACQRDHFDNCAIMYENDEGQPFFYKFVVAMQNPIMIELSPLVRQHDPFPAGVGSTQQKPLHVWRPWLFEVDFLHNMEVHTTGAIHARQLWVLPFLQYVEGNHLASQASLVALEEFLRCLPQPPARRGSGNKPSAAEHKKIIKELPWCEQALSKAALDNESAERCQSEVVAVEEDALDEDAFILLQELDVLVSESVASLHDIGWDFSVEVLKGASTLRLRGKIADAARAYARTVGAIQWCRDRSMPLSARYELDHYGVFFCGVLTRTWCRVMSHLFAGRPGADFIWPSEYVSSRREILATRMGPRRVSELQALLDGN